MSKKQKKAAPAPNNHKKTWLIAAICAAVVLLAAGGGFLAHYLINREPPLITQYNTVLTAKAREEGNITNFEVIIVHTVDDSNPSYTALECYVYQIPNGVRSADVLDYYAHELPDKYGAEQVGTAKARFLKEDLSSLYGLQVFHTK